MWILLWISRVRILRTLLRNWRLAWRLSRDPRTPLRSKLILVGTGLLIVSPINLVALLIPFFGQLEALALLSLGIEFFLRSVPDDLRAEHTARLRPQPR
jgi:uncharacterized membrane protein YkvA (DUF1232 family)